jgi:hypothetical protein
VGPVLHGAKIRHPGGECKRGPRSVMIGV